MDQTIVWGMRTFLILTSMDQRSEITEHHVAIENNLVRFSVSTCKICFVTEYSRWCSLSTKWKESMLRHEGADQSVNRPSACLDFFQLKWLVNNVAFHWISEYSSFPVGENQWTTFRSWNTYIESQIFLWMQYGCLMCDVSWRLVREDWYLGNTENPGANFFLL